MKDEPPDIRLLLVLALIALLSVLSIRGLAMANGFNRQPPYEGNLNIIQGVFLKASLPPFLMEGKTYASLIARIIWCESRGDPKAKNPSSTAKGLCQFLDSTWNYVQEKWDMKLERENPLDQRYACERLLREEGSKHWEESRHCWSK